MRFGNEIESGGVQWRNWRLLTPPKVRKVRYGPLPGCLGLITSRRFFDVFLSVANLRRGLALIIHRQADFLGFFVATGYNSTHQAKASQKQGVGFGFRDDSDRTTFRRVCQADQLQLHAGLSQFRHNIH